MNTHEFDPNAELAEVVEKPECRLVGTDGNVFAVIGNVSRALKNAGQPERASEWCAAAMACTSYDAVLGLAFDYVEVM